MLASLNHPNIAAIYGLEESNGTKALVIELLEGSQSHATAQNVVDIVDRKPVQTDDCASERSAGGTMARASSLVRTSTIIQAL